MMTMSNRRFFATVSILCTTVIILALASWGPSEAKPLAGPSATTPHCGCLPFKTVKNPGNKAFYGADGAFSGGSAKQAYFDMMAAFGYPIRVRGRARGWTRAAPATERAQA